MKLPGSRPVFLSILAVLMVMTATAQRDRARIAPHDTIRTAFHDTLPEVTIKGYSDPGSLRQAIRLQKAAGLIVDVVAEEAIQRSSDLTIADVTRRVGGLSVTTDNAGQSDHTIIRGMDPKYNYTLVDGIKIPSPGDRSRYIPLSLFPADMVQRVEVYKSLTPDMEGDAIGGVVNMVMRNAPDQSMLKVRLAGGYNQTFFDQSYLAFDNHVIRKRSPYELHGPAYQATATDFSKANLFFHNTRPVPDALGSITWGRRFLHQKAGLLVAADYQDIKRGTPNFFIPQNNEPQLNNTPGLTDFYRNNYSTTLIREGFHARTDYVFDPRNSIALYQFYASQQDIESRYRVDTSLSLGRTVPGTGRITISDRSRVHLQHIYSASLHGDHEIASHLSLRWTSTWSVATGLYPDWSELSAGTARIEGANGAITQSPLLLDPLTRTWLRNRERDLSSYLYLDYHRTIKDHQLSVSTGGLYRDKQRDNFYNSYIFQPAITSTQGQLFTDIYHAEWTNDNGPQNPLGAVANPNTYTAHEYIGAGYLSIEWKGKKADWTGGVRYEDTRQEFVSSVDPTTSYGQTGSIRYHDYLPSLLMKYRLTDQQLLRVSWYRSLSRPALYDVTFYSIQYEDYREAGNPFLQRARADNVDLRYEWYPGGLDLLQAGIFYKQIASPYERTLLNAGDELYPIPSQGLPYTPAGELTAQMRNAATAHDYGFEFNATKYVGRLGLQAGYTFTWSHMVQAAKFQTRVNPSDPSSDLVTVTRNESRPLQGQSPHLASLSLLYQDTHNGWNARLSGIYTGRRIYSVSGWYGLDYWQRGYTVLDASVEKKAGRHTKIFAKVNNLFNTVTTVDLLKPNPDFASGLLPGQQRSDRITVMRQTDQAVYYLGFQWSLP
ncbi:MAG TPA: TonB-dependent receptor [Puia sp.]|jgi:outer membrane receptor protein involved in Fe transport